jgi:hypothetical protein
VTAIGGDVTIRRTFAGVHLYDMNLDSDGIVPLSSSQGYTAIQKTPSLPTGASLTPLTDACTIDSDTLELAAEAAEWTKSALAALAVGASQIYADDNALDGVLNGQLTPGLIAYIGAANLAASCSHTRIPNEQNAQLKVADALEVYIKRLKPPVTAGSLPCPSAPTFFNAYNKANGPQNTMDYFRVFRGPKCDGAWAASYGTTGYNGSGGETTRCDIEVLRAKNGAWVYYDETMPFNQPCDPKNPIWYVSIADRAMCNPVVSLAIRTFIGCFVRVP